MTQIRRFVKENSHTNVMVISFPDRQDIEAIYTHMKFFDYTILLKVLFEKEHYTRHGIHLNMKGKDRLARMLVSAKKRHIS
jgi:lysophospholipase L1-like esterase